MRVLILTNLYPPDVLGGYELLARDVAEGLARRGHDVGILTTGAGARQGAVTRTLRLTRPFGQPAGRDRLRHLWSGRHNRAATRRCLRDGARPDAALVMSLRRLGLAPLRALQERGVPFVVTVNDDWPVVYGAGARPRWRARVGRFLDEALVPARRWRGLRPAATVYLSEAVRRSVREAGVPLGAGSLRPQGVDLSIFSPRPFRPMRPEPRLLFVGRLHPSKAPDVALDALAALRQRGLAATLALVGEPVSAAYRDALAQRARALGVEARVTWTGPVPRERLPAVYRDADALLFASRLEHEGQGLTYLEAMACGLPVVAWPSGGAREFLERHDAARLVSACSGDAFADGLLALHRDPGAQQALVTRALGIVTEHASLDAYVRGLEAELLRAAHPGIPPASEP